MGERDVDTGVGGLGMDDLSLEEDAWCTSKADRWPGAATDAEAMPDGLPQAVQIASFGCGSMGEDAKVEAEM